MGNCLNARNKQTDGKEARVPNADVLYKSIAEDHRDTSYKDFHSCQAQYTSTAVQTDFIDGSLLKRLGSSDCRRWDAADGVTFVHTFRNEGNTSVIYKDSHLLKQNDNTDGKIFELENEVRTLKEQLQKQNRTCEAHMKEIETKNNKIGLLGAKCRDLETRLSEQMGVKLTDNNPNIGYLDDPISPEKVSDMFWELNKKQWSDAFDELEALGKREHDICHELLQMLIRIYEACRHDAEVCLQSISDACEKFVQEKPTSSVMKPLKQERKRNFHSQQKHMKKIIKQKIPTWYREEDLGKSTEAYIMQCTEICSLMSIQDPPMYLDNHVDISGQLFDKCLYQHYTQTGKFIDFVVWPVLYLNRNGALLAKGVAEGMSQPKQESTNTSEADYSGAVEIGDMRPNIETDIKEPLHAVGRSKPPKAQTPKAKKGKRHPTKGN